MQTTQPCQTWWCSPQVHVQLCQAPQLKLQRSCQKQAFPQPLSPTPQLQATTEAVPVGRTAHSQPETMTKGVLPAQPQFAPFFDNKPSAGTKQALSSSSQPSSTSPAAPSRRSASTAPFFAAAGTAGPQLTRLTDQSTAETHHAVPSSRKHQTSRSAPDSLPQPGTATKGQAQPSFAPFFIPNPALGHQQILSAGPSASPQLSSSLSAASSPLSPRSAQSPAAASSAVPQPAKLAGALALSTHSARPQAVAVPAAAGANLSFSPLEPVLASTGGEGPGGLGGSSGGGWGSGGGSGGSSGGDGGSLSPQNPGKLGSLLPHCLNRPSHPSL